MIRNLNAEVDGLPDCPLCGYLTRLDKITLRVVKGRPFVAYMLRCVGRHGEPPCPFVIAVSQS